MSEKVNSHQQHRHRQGLLLFTALSTCLFVGASLGWGPMQLMLEDEGSFSSECKKEQPRTDVSNGSICSNQTAKLVKVGLLVPIFQVLSPFLGVFVDKFGPQRTAMVQMACLLGGLGTVLLSIYHSTMSGMDSLLFVGFGLVALNTWFGHLLIVQLGLYFGGHQMARVIFVLNSLFDAGAIIYLVLWGVQQASGASMEVIMEGYLVLAAVVSVGVVYFWRIAVPKGQEDANGTKGLPVDDSKHKLAFDDSKHMVQAKECALEPVCDGTNEGHPKEEGYILVADRPWQQQLKSPHFLLLCASFGLHAGMNSWNIVTQRDFLASLGDDDHDNIYLTIFVLMTPVSLLGTPLIDWIILKYGWMAGLQTINLLGLGYTLVKVASTNLNVQILGFIIFSFYRSFLFGISFSFLPTLVAGHVMGVAAGTMTGVAGLMNLLLIPLVNVAVKQMDGDFFLPNMVMLGSLVPTTGLVCWLQKHMAFEFAAKDPSKCDTVTNVDKAATEFEAWLKLTFPHGITDEIEV